MALAPDGTTIVTVGDELIAWDAATGRERWRAPTREDEFRSHGPAYGMRAVAFGADRSRFYTPGRLGEVVTWETATGRREVLKVAWPRNLLRQPDQSTPSVDVSPDGKWLAVGNGDGLVVCDRFGKLRFEIANKPPGPLKIDNRDRLSFFGGYCMGRFSPDGTMLAVVSSDQPEAIRLLDAATGRELRTIALAAAPCAFGLLPGRRATGHHRAGQRSAALRRPDRAPFLVARGRADRHLRELHLRRGLQPRREPPRGVCHGQPDLPPRPGERCGDRPADRPSLVSLGPRVHGRRQDALLVGLGPGDPPLGRRGQEADRVARGRARNGPGRRLARRPHPGLRRRLGAIRLVDAGRGVERGIFSLPGAHYSQLAFSADGRRLAGGGTRGDQVHVAVWELEHGKLVHRREWPKGRDPHSAVEGLSFAPDGNQLAAVAFRQSAVYLWDLAGQRTARLPHDHAYGLSFSPDGKSLVTVGWDSVIRFWGAENGELRREVRVNAHEKEGDLRMYAVCHVPEGGMLATAHLDGMVRVWQTDPMIPRASFQVSPRFRSEP